MTPIVTCEHGGNDVPPQYAPFFERAIAALDSHRGWDPGSLPIALAIAEALNVQPHFSTTTRLLVDLNRSLDSSTLFSEFIPEEIQEEILKDFYSPYRYQVESAIQYSLPTLHLSIHTFTPHFNGENRTTEIGILFDPDRPQEVAFAETLLPLLSPHYKTDFNSPYQGIADGFTTYLRTQIPNPRYAGIELEFSQAIAYDEALLHLIPPLIQETLHAL